MKKTYTNKIVNLLFNKNIRSEMNFKDLMSKL